MFRLDLLRCRTGCNEGPSAVARTGWRAELCGYYRLGTLALGKLHRWEVTGRKNTLGKSPLGKSLWKIPYISYIIL